jgi:hypothetical protein
MSLKKSQVLMRGLKEKLAFRLPSTYLLTDSVDSSGNPVLTIAQDATWNAGDQYAILRLRPLPSLGVNVLGQAQESFGPHDLSVIVEASGVATKSVLTDVNHDRLMFEFSKLGCVVEFYFSANTVEPTLGGMVVGNLQYRLDDLIFPELITM